MHNADYEQTVSQLNINKENGRKFNQQLEKIAKENPNTEMVATEVPMNVERVKQYRADLVVQKKNGDLVFVEGKASSIAPHTLNQKIDFANNGNKLIGNATFTKKEQIYLVKVMVLQQELRYLQFDQAIFKI